MRWLVLVLAGCQCSPAPVRSSPPPPPSPPLPPQVVPDAKPARVGDCNDASDCELQSRCQWSQPAQCVPHERWMEMLCGNNDPPDPARKPERCGCTAHKCMVVP